MSSQLIKILRTKDDLDILQGELDVLEGALYQTDIKYNDVINNDIRSWVSEIVIKESTKDTLKEYISNLRKDIKTIPVLSMSIYFEPSLTFIEKMSAWFKTNVDEKIVIDIMLNTAMLGGTQLSYNGKYIDLSLRKRISKELENVSLSNKVK